MAPSSTSTHQKPYPPTASTKGAWCSALGWRDIEAASEELAEAGCELLGEITRIEEMNYAYRHFKGPDGRVYGLNEQKKK